MASPTIPAEHPSTPVKRTRRTDGWTTLGRYAAFAFVVVWVTSVLTYYTDVL